MMKQYNNYEVYTNISLWEISKKRPMRLINREVYVKISQNNMYCVSWRKEKKEKNKSLVYSKQFNSKQRHHYFLFPSFSNQGHHNNNDNNNNSITSFLQFKKSSLKSSLMFTQTDLICVMSVHISREYVISVPIPLRRRRISIIYLYIFMPHVDSTTDL